MEKQIVEYPCQWSFRIIGAEEELIRSAVEEYMEEAAYQLTASNVSRSGKYVAINLETIVLNEDERNRIYIDVKNMACVKMVL
jgi:putative lipoic acid-binding regulatory protein